MNRPLLAFAGLLVVGTTTVGVYVAAPGGGEEEVVQQVATASPSGDIATTAGSTASPTTDVEPAPRTPGLSETLWRWGNVTLLTTPDSGVLPVPTHLGPNEMPPDGGPAFELIRRIDGENTSNAFVDAETGAMVAENVRPEDRVAMDSVLRTLTVGSLDRESAPWPFNGEPGQNLPREQGRISYLHPLPAAGLYAYTGLADPGGAFVSLRNERSTAFVRIDATTGTVTIDTSAVKQEDILVFDRWLATVRRCASDEEC